MKPRTHIRPNSTLGAALALVELGWPVLPILGVRNGICVCSKGAQCNRPGKHPATTNGIKDATTDEATIRRWFAGRSDRNIAIATGEASGLLVLDIDPRNGGNASFNALVKVHKAPKTLRSITGGGGRHFFFQYSEEAAAAYRRDALGKGIDLQGDDKYVIVPPSLHSSGGIYTWFEDRFKRPRLAPFPVEWIAAIHVSASSAQATTGSAAPDGVHDEGQRNERLASLAGSLVNAGLSFDGIYAALIAENTMRCRPALPEDEVRRIAASVSRYPVHAPTGDDAETFTHALLHRHFAGGDHLVLGPDGRLWRFAGSQWSPMPEEALAQLALQVSNEAGVRVGMTKTALLAQVRTLIRAKVFVDGDPLRFRRDPLQVVNCTNGELWLRPDGSVEMKPHDARSYLRHTLEVAYDPAARCPQYDRATKEIFSRSSEPQALVRFWHEICGYALQPSRRNALIVIGNGKGSNGKTQLAATLIRMLGNEAVIATNVEAIDKERFIRGYLLGKQLMIDDDVKAGTRLPDGALKKISEEKLMTGELKGGQHFQFVSRVLPLLLCNNFPSVADLSVGLQRRLVVVPFERTFQKEEADIQLFNRIWTTEMPGILNLYLAGLKRVITNNWHFQRPAAVEKATAEFITGANPLPEFLEQMCNMGATKSGSLDVLYTTFASWTKENGITLTQQKHAFRKNLEHLGHKIVHKNDGNHVVGVVLKIADRDV